MRGGRFYFTRIIILLEDRAPIPPLAESSRGESREPRLFMDGFSFNFRQGISRSAALVVLTTASSLPLKCPYAPAAVKRVLYAMFDRLKRHGRETRASFIWHFICFDAFLTAASVLVALSLVANQEAASIFRKCKVSSSKLRWF